VTVVTVETEVDAETEEDAEAEEVVSSRSTALANLPSTSLTLQNVSIEASMGSLWLLNGVTSDRKLTSLKKLLSLHCQSKREQSPMMPITTSSSSRMTRRLTRCTKSLMTSALNTKLSRLICVINSLEKVQVSASLRNISMSKKFIQPKNALSCKSVRKLMLR